MLSGFEAVPHLTMISTPKKSFCKEEEIFIEEYYWNNMFILELSFAKLKLQLDPIDSNSNWIQLTPTPIGSN
jgi:hypothetical protein